MLSADEAIARLCDPEARVSCHYLVTKTGEVVRMVPEERRAWHAGRSYWRGITDVNDDSIGIELDNPGHTNGYEPFPDAQIEALSCFPGPGSPGCGWLCRVPRRI
jgi:N-acetylmuramoyl-L-alanine amidase